jgi:hypothetical protein
MHSYDFQIILFVDVFDVLYLIKHADPSAAVLKELSHKILYTFLALRTKPALFDRCYVQIFLNYMLNFLLLVSKF